MRKKKILTILLTVIVFLAAVTLGVANVYRIDAVTLDVSLFSSAAETDATELREKLLERYRLKSIFFTERTEADEEFSEYPHFRLTSFQRAYPNRLVITATEDAEAFAVKKANGGYYILGADGTVLAERDTAANRYDGADNILLEGFSAVGEKGKPLSGDDALPALFEFCKTADKLLSGNRSNFISIELIRHASAATETEFAVTMREGVVGHIFNPYMNAEKKASAYVYKYLSLDDEERLDGSILVTDSEKDASEVVTVYRR